MEISEEMMLQDQQTGETQVKSVSYWLGVERTEKLSDDSTPRNRHFHEGLVELSFDDYTECLQAIGKIRSLKTYAQIFMLIVWNYQDFEQELDLLSQAYNQGNKEYFSHRYPYLNLNRHILNLLSSARTYLDHTETLLKRDYAHEPALLGKFTLLTRDAYDNSFSYRFLYKFRDYAQHCGLPIGSLISIKRESIEHTGETEHILDIYIKRDILLEEFDWKRLRTEIQQLSERIYIHDHIIGMMNLLYEINTGVVAGILPLLEPVALYTNSFLQQISTAEGAPCFFAFTPETDKNGKAVNLHTRITHIPTKLIEAVTNSDVSEFTGLERKK